MAGSSTVDSQSAVGGTSSSSRSTTVGVNIGAGDAPVSVPKPIINTTGKIEGGWKIVDYDHSSTALNEPASRSEKGSTRGTPTRDEHPVWKVTDDIGGGGPIPASFLYDPNSPTSPLTKVHGSGQSNKTNDSPAARKITYDGGEKNMQNLGRSHQTNASSKAVKSIIVANKSKSSNGRPSTGRDRRTSSRSRESSRVSEEKSGQESGDKNRKSSDSGRSTSNSSDKRSNSCGSLSKDRKLNDAERSRRSTSRGNYGGSKRSRTDSRSRERDLKESPRRPRKLNVNYDKIRAKYGKALPPRTYSPLHPPPKDTPLPQAYNKESAIFWQHNYHHKQIHTHTHNHTPIERHTSKQKSGNTDKHSSTSSDKRHHEFSSLSSKTGSTKKIKEVSDQVGTARVVSHAYQSSGTYNRTKKGYSTSAKRAAASKNYGKSVNGPKREVKVEGDGVGVMKIRPNQRKIFMSTCVEDYYLKKDGSLAKGLKPALAFKVGNPQFVSEFYEKKTELAASKLVRATIKVIYFVLSSYCSAVT